MRYLILLALGCAGGGNYADAVSAEPDLSLCIEVTPPEAQVTVDEVALPEDGCLMVFEGVVELAARADGYAPWDESLPVSRSINYFIDMVPLGEDTAAP